jgi:hypothetical protein
MLKLRTIGLSDYAVLDSGPLFAVDKPASGYQRTADFLFVGTVPGTRVQQLASGSATHP